MTVNRVPVIKASTNNPPNFKEGLKSIYHKVSQAVSKVFAFIKSHPEIYLAIVSFTTAAVFHSLLAGCVLGLTVGLATKAIRSIIKHREGKKLLEGPIKEYGSIENALINFVKKNDEKMIKACIEHKANINHVDKDGKTPLFHAVQNNSNSLVTLLLNTKGIDKQKKYYGKTAFEIAATEGHLEATKAFVDKLEPNPIKPLANAVENGKTSTVRVFLSDFNSSCKYKFAPKDLKGLVQKACEENHPQILSDILLSYPNACTKDELFGYLVAAASDQRDNIIKVFLNFKPDCIFSIQELDLAKGTAKNGGIFDVVIKDIDAKRQMHEEARKIQASSPRATAEARTIKYLEERGVEFAENNKNRLREIRNFDMTDLLIRLTKNHVANLDIKAKETFTDDFESYDNSICVQMAQLAIKYLISLPNSQKYNTPICLHTKMSDIRSLQKSYAGLSKEKKKLFLENFHKNADTFESENLKTLWREANAIANFLTNSNHDFQRAYQDSCEPIIDSFEE